MDYKDNTTRSIKIAEFFMKKHDFANAINQWKYVLEVIEHKSINVYFKLFDCYLLINDFVSANEVYKKIYRIFGSNPNYLEKIEDRKNNLNSAEAKRYNVEINCLDQELVKNKQSNELSFQKAKSLTHYKLEFVLKNINFGDAFVIEYFCDIYQSKIQTEIIHAERSIFSSDQIEYVVSINLLNIKRIGVISIIDGAVQWLFTFARKGIINVIRGRDSWLFLDNDASNSVSQFKGEMLISEDEMLKWKLYLEKFSSLSNSVFVVPPSKEMVFPNYHPFIRGQKCPIDQLKSMLNNYNCFSMYPIDILSKDLTSYIKTETHWSYKAAYNVFLSILDKWNIDYSKYKDIFQFRLQRFSGDLGSKLEEREYSDYYVIATGTANVDTVFNNFYRLQQGHIIKYQNNNSFFNKKIVIFGDSFSENFLPFFTTYFSSVIKVRSNATVIQDIINYEEPDYIVCEIAERFVIRAPLFLDKISEYSPCMRKDLADEDLIKIKNYKVSSENSVYDEYMVSYGRLLSNNQ